MMRIVNVVVIQILDIRNIMDFVMTANTDVGVKLV